MINTDIQLMGGGYVANISSCRGGTCFRLLHTPTGADILRTPRDAAHLRENVFLFGNSNVAFKHNVGIFFYCS